MEENIKEIITEITSPAETPVEPAATAEAPEVQTEPTVEPAAPAVAPEVQTEPTVEPAADTDAPVEVKDVPADAPAADTPAKKKTFKLPRMSKGTKYLFVLVELMLLVIAVLVFTRSVSLNRHDDKVYADPGQVDYVSCTQGNLKVNNVNVSVPTNRNVAYNISYVWSKEDKDYPTVPRSVTASYRNKQGDLYYDISLYRDSVTPTSELPEGKNAGNWFSDWETVNSKERQSNPKDTGSLHGFLITNIEEIQKGESGSTYATSTYYFALESEGELSVYILEGILYDKSSQKAFEKIMEDSINSITIKQEPV